MRHRHEGATRATRPPAAIGANTDPVIVADNQPGHPTP